jgi:soluble lytic murein transglycosylase-like protein
LTVNGESRLLDTQYLDSGTTHRTSRHRWLYIVGLCFFIGLTAYSNKEDSTFSVSDMFEFQAENSSNINISAEPFYYKAVINASTMHALDPNLIATIIYVESRGNIKAVSPKGAKGLMQLTPVVYQKYNVSDPFDIEQNISVGTAYLAFLLRKFDGNLEHALAAYNCGPTRVHKHKGIPPIKETREYVVRIMNFYLRGEVPTGAINQAS